MENKNLWKGIAIAGIWIGLAACIWAAAWVDVTSKNVNGWDASFLIIMAVLLSWNIKNRDEKR